jgi:SAM-dependent methyltransferase
MFRTSCLVCNSLNLARIIDLGMHPFADTFIPESRLSESEPVYPLSCDLCKDCGHIQTSCITNPLDRYASYDYSYTSANSVFSQNHWQNYAKEVPECVNLEKDSFVIDVGSNDGFLPEHFKKNGYKVLGVDPSPFMAELAKEKNVETFIGLFNSENATRINKNYSKAMLITANNVFNHSDAPQDFVKAVELSLAENGTFVFESPYWLSTFETKKFDQIYHEHVSYFTVRSAKKLLEAGGMKIIDVKLVNYHGGSLRVFAKRKDEAKEESPSVKELIEKEDALKLFDPNTYAVFMKDISSQRNAFLKEVYEIKSKGSAIIAIGAAAKGNTFLNFYNLNHTVLDYVTDSSPYKCDKYTPLSRIPIKNDDVFSKYKDVYAIILSWNIAGQLKNSLSKINKEIKFISPEK